MVEDWPLLNQLDRDMRGLARFFCVRLKKDLSKQDARMRLFRLLFTGLVPLLLTACEREEPVPMGQPGAPMYTVDPDATGPLTFAELRVNFTALDHPTSERQRRCVKKAIERRAQDLGDPASYQPEDHDYHGGQTSNAQWQAFDNREQRTLLAQVIITYAFIDCD